MIKLDISLMLNICGGVLMASAVIASAYVVYKVITGVVGLWWNWVKSD